MPELSGSEYGILGVALVGLIFIANKLIDNYTTKKSTPDTQDKSDKQDEELKELLQNNTKALVELTQFLRTQAEVNNEKEKQSNKQLDTIESKLDHVIELQTKHNVKCASLCQLKGGN